MYMANSEVHVVALCLVRWPSRAPMGVFLAAGSRGWVGLPPLPPPLGWPRLARNGGGYLAQIKENEEKTATLGVPRGASHPLLTCGYVCQCIWGN